METAERHRVVTFRRAALVVAGLLLSSCSAPGQDDAAPSTSREDTTAVDHQEELAEAEDLGIASQLVDVPGYRYDDIDPREVDGILQILEAAEDDMGIPEVYRSVSLHSVVADDPTQNRSRRGDGAYEVGFLALIEFVEPPPATASETWSIFSADGREPIDELALSGTTVWVFEDPSAPESRYKLVWLRHGVQGNLDGAELEPLTTWAEAYLAIPEREPEEDDLLARSLPDVDGFAYVNYWDPSITEDLGELFLEDPASVHAVVDAEGTVGVLSLVDVPPPFDGDDLADEVDALELTDPVDEVVAGVTTIRGTDPSGTWQARVWWRDGVLGAFIAPVGADDLRFVRPYLAE